MVEKIYHLVVQLSKSMKDFGLKEFLKPLLHSMRNFNEYISAPDMFKISGLVYDNAISALDLITYIENNFESSFEKYNILVKIRARRKDIRSEKILIFMIIFYFSKLQLQNSLK